MKKIIKRNIIVILLAVWMIAVSAVDSELTGWWFTLEIFLCIAPLATVAWLCNKGWLDDIDVEE